VYVGDTPNDVRAGIAGGAVPVAVATGPHDADELLAAGAAVVLSSLAEFPAWLAARPPH
jgi:phosphoglycolate phosphatase